MPYLRNIAWQARAFWALLASAFKHEWTIEDYPIVARFQRDSHVPREARLKPSPWIAAIVNWPAISGNGNTKLEALEDLRRSFDRFEATKNKLPRPGSKVPIEFADRNRVSQHPELLTGFINRVLELDWAWISDESSLGDFHGDETNDKLIEKIRHVYGVDVSDIQSGNLADIFDRITKSGAATTVPSPD